MNMTATQKPSKPLDIIRFEMTGRLKNQFALALPEHVPVDRFVRVAMTAIAQNPDLQKADRTSLFAACMTAAQLGLVTDGVLGQAYLVPYKGRVQLIPGYRGLLKLVRQSGEISSIDVDTIHANDKVTLRGGDDSLFRIEIDWKGRGEIIGAYAIAHFKDGGLQRAVMTRDEIEDIRKASPSANSPAWKNHYGEMAKKTVFRRLAKMLPLSTEAERALAIDDASDAGKPARLDQGDVVLDAEAREAPPPQPKQSRLDRLADVQDAEIVTPDEIEAEPVDEYAQEDGDLM